MARTRGAETYLVTGEAVPRWPRGSAPRPRAASQLVPPSTGQPRAGRAAPVPHQCRGAAVSGHHALATLDGPRTRYQPQPRSLALFNKRVHYAGQACHRESAPEAECQLSTSRTTVN
jgi:hypothetical protein